MWGGRILVKGFHDRQAINTYANFVDQIHNKREGYTIILLYHEQGPLHMHQYIIHIELEEEVPASNGFRQIPAIEGTFAVTDYSDLAGRLADLRAWKDSRIGCAVLLGNWTRSS